MSIGLLFVVLDGLEECSSLHHNVFILNWYHLVKIYGLSLILGFRWLVIESGGARSKRFKMISRTKLVIKNLKFILNLSIVSSRSRIDLSLLWDLVHEVSLDWWNKWIVHVWIGYTKTRAHRLQNLLLSFISVNIRLIFDRSWWLKMRWISERHESNISANKIISLGRGPEVEICPALDELCLFLRVEDVVIVVHNCSWTRVQELFFTWLERVPLDSRFETHVSFVLWEGLHLL